MTYFIAIIQNNLRTDVVQSSPPWMERRYFHIRFLPY